MNIQKKRFVVYFLFILFGLTVAFLFLRKKNSATNDIVPETIVKKDSIVTVTFLSEFFNIENNNEGFVSAEKALSGKHSCKLSKEVEFGISVSKFAKDIPTFNNLKNISIKFNAFWGNENPDALYVLSIDDSKGKNVFWDGKPILYSKTNDWIESTIDFVVPAEFLSPDNRIVVYPWNRNKKVFYVDDITIDFIGTAIYAEGSTNQSEKSNIFLDFETEAGFSGADNVKETTAHSGKRSCDLSGGKEYGPALNKKLNEFGSAFPGIVNLSMWVYPLVDNPNTVLVASVISSKNESVFWEGKSTENKSFPKNTWTKINAYFKLPIEKFNSEDVLGVSVWNKGKTDVIVDDIEIVYGKGPERRGKESKIDPISIYEKRFVAEKNKPPFQTIYFEKQEIGNKNGRSLTPPDPKVSTCSFSPNDEFFVGDFFPDKNNLDEILCISSDGCKGLYVYSVEEKRFNNLWQKARLDDSIWFFWDKCSIYSGNFNSDNKQDVLLVEKQNNNWEIINFNGKEWLTVSKGNNPKKEWLNKNKNETTFPGNYFGYKQTILKRNNEWRFDLKLMDGNNILGNVDFKGYPNDYNPKYYEFVKLVPGNFLSSKQTSLLVVMCNCGDADFSGLTCKQIEDLSYLPNSVQLYSIEKKGFSQISQINADKNK